MPKKFEQQSDGHYDPFAAEEKRAAIRAATGNLEPKAQESTSIEEDKLSVKVLTPALAAKPKKTAPSRKTKPEGAPQVQGQEAKLPGALQLEKTSSRAASALARTAQRQSVQKRFRVTEPEEEDFEAFVLRLRKASSSKVDFSVVCRSLWTVIQHAEAQVLEELRKTDVPKRPGKHDTLALAEYEELWARLLSQALRQMGPLR